MAEVVRPDQKLRPVGRETVHVRTPDGRSKLAVLLDADDIVEQRLQHHVHGFADFLREYSVIGLAVGFVAGSQVTVVVKQLLTSFLTPAFLLFFGKDLNTASVTVHWHGRSAVVNWGASVYALIDFLFILIIVYIAIKLFKLDRFQKKEKAKK